MKKLNTLFSFMAIVLVISATTATAMDLGTLFQAHAQRKAYNEDVTIENIDGQSHVDITTTNGSITVQGDINGQSTVRLMAQNGTITIAGNVDGASQVVLFADGGIVINGRVMSDGTVVRYKAPSIKIYGGTVGKATVVRINKNTKPASTSTN